MSDIFKLAKAANGEHTPLRADCGGPCDKACRRGNADVRMLLFPGEQTVPKTVEVSTGRLAVCSGECDRAERPLACMFFPFFPCLDEEGKVYARIDSRAMRICPIAANSGMVVFSRRFIRRVERAGRILARDGQCAEFMREITEQIKYLDRFYG